MIQTIHIYSINQMSLSTQLKHCLFNHIIQKNPIAESKKAETKSAFFHFFNWD
ncbi:hypothetical protein [Vibrio gallaecicus]|uniref:hypothetical protein n=1 Tax=Vibrio gallaecicus TaxID=552386 RepID=UPI0025B595A7|nr:hypothetical protein [Vibrio gallaecicus]MDN3613164.1 hypothetical protein [Vibrio gallaecicus]